MLNAPPDLLTNFLAVWGATTGTLALAWTVYRDQSDRGELKVRGFLGYIQENGDIALASDVASPAEVSGDGVLRIIWKITNVGRRSRVVSHVGGQVRSTGAQPGVTDSVLLVRHPDGDKELEPGGTDRVSTDIEPGLAEYLDQLYAIDTLGEKYFVPQADVQQIRATAKAQNDR
jgi:hypothetical protein